MTKFVSWFKDVDVSQTSLFGEQAAKISDLYKNNFPVPIGFVINKSAFKEFIEQNGMAEKITQLINTENSEEIMNLIMSAEIPNNVSERILTAYHSLETGGERFSRITNTALEMIRVGRTKTPLVTIETSNNYAGTLNLQRNVQGDKQLLENVKKAWTTIFSPAGLIQIKQSQQIFETGIIIKKELETSTSTISYSKHPINFNDEIFAESVWGGITPLLESEITPDSYVISKQDGTLKNKRVSTQNWMIYKDLRTNTLTRKELSYERANSQVLNPEIIKKIAYLTNRVEKYFGAPQKIMFVTEGNRIYITRVEHIKKNQETTQITQEGFIELLKAHPTTMGIGIGKAKIIQLPRDFSQINQGNIIITKKPLPGIEKALLKSNGLIIGSGGISSKITELAITLKKPVITGVIDFTIFDENYETMINAENGVISQKEITQQQTILQEGLLQAPTLNENIKLSIETSSEQALQTIMQMCKQYGVQINVINKPEEIIKQETPFMQEIPETITPQFIDETPTNSFLDEPKQIIKPEEQFSVQDMLNKPAQENPLPLPQTRIETENYEEPISPKPENAYTIGDDYQEKKEPEKKKENKDELVPYW
ncbi:MAG: hypothetical protein GON13_03530 [Nanoarchaeota archaeon]|nr:hypothetical protein [Nanoarchaeota archaeon]